MHELAELMERAAKEWRDGDEGPPVAPVRLVRRSTLILPVNVPRFVEKAHLRGADAIMLDLEDSVPEAEKAAARRLLPEAARSVGRGGGDVLVRLNKPLRHVIPDLDAAVVPGVSGVVLPKAESAAEVEIVAELLSRLEAQRGIPAGTVQIGCLIETARGLRHADEIAAASPRVVSVSLGTEDFTLDLDTHPTPDGLELLVGKALVVLAARRAGVQAHGLVGSLADFQDLAALERAARRARELGCWGASCIHPNQVDVLNRVFSPDPAAVAHARRVVEVYEEAERRGRASAALDGKMIDVPVVLRARRLLARADAIAAMEARKRAALARLGVGGHA